MIIAYPEHWSSLNSPKGQEWQFRSMHEHCTDKSVLGAKPVAAPG